jgi:sialate O-acetylesterase
VLSFTHAEGLASKAGALTGFVIAGEDGRFQEAKATIEGTTVRVRSSVVTKPVAVRYAWSNNPTCNLVNGAGLPASPFRFPTK